MNKSGTPGRFLPDVVNRSSTQSNEINYPIPTSNQEIDYAKLNFNMMFPVCIPPALIEALLQTKKPSDLIALMTYYIYLSQKTGSTRIVSTTKTTSKALKWSISRVQEAKKTLREFGLIEDLRYEDRFCGKVHYYIKIGKD